MVTILWKKKEMLDARNTVPATCVSYLTTEKSQQLDLLLWNIKLSLEICKEKVPKVDFGGLTSHAVIILVTLTLYT